MARRGSTVRATSDRKALHVVERISARSPETLNYEATIEDPETFTKPWKMSMPLYRRVEKNAQISEFRCVEFSEEVVYGHLAETEEVVAGFRHRPRS